MQAPDYRYRMMAALRILWFVALSAVNPPGAERGEAGGTAPGRRGQEGEAPRRRIGLVGCGRFASFLLTAAARLPRFQLTALASRTEENRAATAALWRRLRPSDPPCLSFSRWQDLLAVPLDAVVITAPPHLHEEMGLACLAAGRHVFLEKPGALRPEGLLALQREADRRGLAAAVNMVFRQNPIYRLVRSSLAGGWRADLELVEVANEAHGDLPRGHWFWDRTRSGGILVEHGIHFLDLCAWLAGEGRPVAAWESPCPPARTSPRVLALVEHTVGSRATLAVHGHAFVHTPGRGRCRVRFVWRDCFLSVEGWTARRACLEGSVPPAVAELWRAAGAREEGLTAASQAGSATPGGTRLTLDLGEEEDLYREAVARNLAGFLSMTDPGPRPAPRPAAPAETALLPREVAGPPPSPGELAPVLALAVRLRDSAASSALPSASPGSPPGR